MSEDIWTIEDLKGRIASFYNEKKASEEASEETKEAAKNDPVPETDPQEENPPGVEKHDGDSADKTVLPSKGLETQNADGIAENNIPGKGGKGEASGKAPNGAGEGGHAASDGDSKDEAVSSPTDPSVAKTASKAKQLADAIRDKILNKEAKRKCAEGEEKEADEDKEAKPLVGNQDKLPEDIKDEIKAANGGVEAIAGDFDESKNAYLKIANLVMQHEDGRQMVSNLADREFGRAAAENLIKEAEELEMYEQAVAQEEQQTEAAAAELLKSASEEDVSDIAKLIKIHSNNIGKYETEAEKQAYDLGCKQAAMAMDAGGEMPMGPEAAMGGEMPMGEEGGEGAGMEDVSLDEVAAVIMQMVESGEIDPAMAEQILAELAGADGGMEGGEELPPEEGALPPEDVEKMASIVENAFSDKK